MNPLSSLWWNPASHRERQGGRLTRREEGAYSQYVTDEQRSSGGMHRRSNAARVSPLAVRSRWPVARRVLLVSIVLIVAYRNYGDNFKGWFIASGPETEIVITHTEFRTDLEGDLRPAWFIGLLNRSDDTVYDNIVLEATYFSGATILETDRLIIEQRLRPGQEELIGSRDSRVREGATAGQVRVIGAEVVE